MGYQPVRYLVQKAGAGGALPRWFWEPSPALRRRGWRTRRVPHDWPRYRDAESLRGAAIAEATGLNRAVLAAAYVEPASEQLSPRTVRALIDDYQRTPHFDGLSPSTKQSYREWMRLIDKWIGPGPVAAVGWQDIQTLRENMKDRPALFAAVVRTLRMLLNHAIKLEWVQHNIALRPDLQTRPARAGLVWPAGAVEAFVAAADKMDRFSVGTAVLLNSWLGQREGDVLRLTRAAWRDGALHIRQSKTGAGVSLPIDMVPEVAARLAEGVRRADARHAPALPLILDEQTGRGWKPSWFRQVFAQIREAAAVEHPSFQIDYLLPGRRGDDPHAFTIRMTDLWFMHLRHTAVTRLQEAECEVALIAAVTGHSLAGVSAILERYGRRTRQLAQLAFRRRREAEATASGNRLRE